MGTRFAVPEVTLSTENLPPRGSVKENRHLEDPVAFIFSEM
jgi:hypothetical protein